MSEGFWTIVFRRGKVYVPTTARTEAGFYLAIEPVLVADESDTSAVEEAVISTVERGNPVVPTPSRNDYKEYVLLKHAGVKSLSTFEKSARTWKLSRRGVNFLIAPYRPGRHGGAEEDLERQESIPDTVPLTEVVRRLVHRALNEAADMEGYRDTD
jgi:hypothetical protein